jgi:carbon monoxide dehydrogenase subunit G
MAHAENSITIARPIDEVFAFLLDGTNNIFWRPAVLSVERKAGAPDGVGAVYAQQLKGPVGRPIAGDYQIVTCEPNTHLAFQVIEGPARPTGAYNLTTVLSGTNVQFVLDLQPTGIVKLMDGLIAQTMRSEVATLSNLKSYLERADN